MDQIIIIISAPGIDLDDNILDVNHFNTNPYKTQIPESHNKFINRLIGNNTAPKDLNKNQVIQNMDVDDYMNDDNDNDIDMIDTTDYDNILKPISNYDEIDIDLMQQSLNDEDNSLIPSIKNVLLNHPIYNDTYFNMLYDTNDIEVPLDTVMLNVVQPHEEVIEAVADNGAELNVINHYIAQKYKHKLRQDKKGKYIQTGSGSLTAHEYLPLTLKYKSENSNNTKTINTRFYVINDLPYDYLIGRPLLHLLDYELIQKKEIYHHKPEYVDAMFNDFNCSQYPTWDDSGRRSDIPQLDYDIINVKNEPAIKQYLFKLIASYNKVIALSEFDIGAIKRLGIEFPIDFKDNVDTNPVTLKEYPCNAHHIEEIERQLTNLRKHGLISYSTSPWQFPTFVVPKKTGDARIVFDYRALNDITLRMNYQPPNPSHLFNKFKNKNFISSIDIKSGYWNVPVRVADRSKLAFSFNNKLYEWNVMPFGPTNAPGYFQYVMEHIFGDHDFIVVYMDDISILSDTWKDHQKHLKIVFDILKSYNIKIRIDKCQFAMDEIQYLGLLVNKYGIKPTQKYKQKIFKINTPKTVKQMQRLIGLITYIGRFIPLLYKHQKILSDLIHKDNVFHINNKILHTIEMIKSIIDKNLFLFHPDFKKKFYVITDASIDGIGGMLGQYVSIKYPDILVPIDFASHIFNPTQRRWHVSEQELYAIVYFIEKWSYYLVGSHFNVFTDHKNLELLFNKSQNFKTGKLFRWAVRLQDYDFTCNYLPGKENLFCDYLSRDGIQDNVNVENIDYDNDRNNKTHDILSLYIKHLCYTSINTPSPVSKTDLYSHDFYYGIDNILQYNRDNPLALCAYPKKDDAYNIRDDLPGAQIKHFVGKKLRRSKRLQKRKPVINTQPMSLDINLNNNNDNKLKQQLNDIQINNMSNNDKHLKQQLIDIQNGAQKQNKNEIQQSVNDIKQQLQNVQNDRIKLLFDKIDNIKKELDTNKSLPNNTKKKLKNKIIQIEKSIKPNLIHQNNEDIYNKKRDHLTNNKALLSPDLIPIFDIYNIPDLSHDTIRMKQKHDPIAFGIKDFLINNNRNVIDSLPRYLKRYLTSARFKIKDNILYFNHNNIDCLYIPPSLRFSVLQYGHSALHHGRYKMRWKLKHFYWPKMYKDIIYFCRM